MPLGAHKAAIMGVAGTSAAGDVVLIQSQTASSDATINFTSGIDSTYGEYIFRFYNIHPETDSQAFTFQGSIDGGSNYNVAMTTSNFRAGHREGDTFAAVGYKTDQDQAQGTAYQNFIYDIDNDADSNTAGELHIFNPASTTFVKHFYARFSGLYSSAGNFDSYTAGYFNTTSAINAISFKFASGDIDVGTLKMWGVK